MSNASADVQLPLASTVMAASARFDKLSQRVSRVTRPTQLPLWLGCCRVGRACTVRVSLGGDEFLCGAVALGDCIFALNAQTLDIFIVGIIAARFGVLPTVVESIVSAIHSQPLSHLAMCSAALSHFLTLQSASTQVVRGLKR